MRVYCDGCVGVLHYRPGAAYSENACKCDSAVTKDFIFYVFSIRR